MFAYSFDHLWVLVLLLLVLGIYWTLVFTARKRSLIPYPPLQFQKAKILPRFLFTGVVVLESLVLILLFVSLAKPYKSSEIVSIEENGIDIVIAVDVSASMQAKDFAPNRLEATKKIITEFVRRGSGNRIGIVVFAKHVFTLSPMTTDPLILADLVSGLSFRTIDHYVSGGTAIGDAILRAADILRTAKIPKRDQVMVLLTDGDSNFGSEIKLAARFTNENNIRIYSIGIGSTENITVEPDPTNPSWTFETRLFEEPMKEIAALTQGSYFQAKDETALNEIFVQIQKLEESPLEVDRVSQKKFATYPLNLSATVLFCLATLGKVLWLRRPLK